MTQPQEQAVIDEVPSSKNGYFYVITTVGTEDRPSQVHYLNGVSVPCGGSVGQAGILSYRTANSYGRHIWKPNSSK